MSKLTFKGFKPRYGLEWAGSIVDRAIEKYPRGWCFTGWVFDFGIKDWRRIMASGSRVWRYLRDFSKQNDHQVALDGRDPETYYKLHDARQLALWGLLGESDKLNPWERNFLIERLEKLDAML